MGEEEENLKKEEAEKMRMEEEAKLQAEEEERLKKEEAERIRMEEESQLKEEEEEHSDENIIFDINYFLHDNDDDIIIEPKNSFESCNSKEKKQSSLDVN